MPPFAQVFYVDSIRMRRPCFCATLIQGSMRLAAAPERER
jgi:hypothetical protein